MPQYFFLLCLKKKKKIPKTTSTSIISHTQKSETSAYKSVRKYRMLDGVGKHEKKHVCIYHVFTKKGSLLSLVKRTLRRKRVSDAPRSGRPRTARTNLALRSVFPDCRSLAHTHTTIKKKSGLICHEKLSETSRNSSR